ncbi:MAG: hypothetical protein KBF80_00265 [Flavobacteriales bacterium]|nr:hypothetical protein [Flavobacteriales bacterium]
MEAFIAKAVQSSGSREGVAISTDSAEWYIEAALNYSYTNIAQVYNDQLVDTLAISIPMVAGEVQEDQLGDAYETLGYLINAFNVANSSHVAVVDVITSSTGSSLDITAVSVVGSNYDKGAPNTNYGQNDYWNWMGINENYCGCGQNSGGQGKCSDKQIQYRINYGINGGYLSYWTNVESWWVDHQGYDDPTTNTVGLMSHPSPIGPDNPMAGDDIRDYPVYFSDNGVGCFNPTDMKFYTQGTYDLMVTTRNSYVPTKSLVGCTVLGDLAMGGGGSDKLHLVTYRYGKLAKTQQ